MGRFGNPGRRDDASTRHAVPRGFEAVAEAVEQGADVGPACAVLGRDLGRDGFELGGALASLRETYGVLGRDVDASALETFAVAWAEETLSFVHHVSCEDPLTGLASMAHVRARLTEIYRAADGVVPGGGDAVAARYALLVVDLPGVEADPFTRALQLTRLSEIVRLVFTAGEPMCHVAHRRLIAVCRRGERFGRQLAALHELTDVADDVGAPRVWVERLPGGIDAAVSALDEVARLTTG